MLGTSAHVVERPVRESPQARELRLTKERLAVLAQVTAPVVGKRSLRAVLFGTLERVCATFEMDACVVRTLSRGELVLVASTGVQPEALVERLPNRYGISERLLRERLAISIVDVSRDPLTRALARSAENDPHQFVFRSYAGVPLMVRHHVIGVLGLYKIAQTREFDAAELKNLQILANHIAVTIINHRLYHKLADQHRALESQIGERMRTEQQNVELESQLRRAQRLDALGKLAGGVAHDFNNMLTAILSYAELLQKAVQERNVDLEFLGEAAGALQTAGTHGANLTRQLLAFSRRQPSTRCCWTPHRRCARGAICCAASCARTSSSWCRRAARPAGCASIRVISSR